MRPPKIAASIVSSDFDGHFVPWTDEDDAPDLSTPEYQAKFDAVPVRRGARRRLRRKSARRRLSATCTTIWREFQAARATRRRGCPGQAPGMTVDRCMKPKPPLASCKSWL